MLARALADRGDAVRGTTRDPAKLSAVESAGAEPVLADPDRVATLIGALDHVTVACILLGSATGPPEQLRALHGTRLEMLLTKLVDTTVRGLVYEARGTVGSEILTEGARQVLAFGERSLARTALLEAESAVPGEWLAAALEAVERTVD